MGRKTRVLAKKRLDKFYRLAKDEGYQSRAAFKLIQINREYNFLGNCKCLIDLCAAPGGWTQVAAKYMPLSSHIIAVDIEKMKPIPGCVTIQADITTQKCKFEIKKHIHGYPVDAIIHDGAPNVTGAWTKDAYGQCELTLSALKLATQFLRVGGIFVTKVFRSADYNSLLWVLQQLFDQVTTYKPIASRSSSAETYLICQDYLAPKKIDGRLLDPKFVFREIEEKKEVQSVMQKKKKRKERPSRVGYDQDGLLYKTASIMDFINSETPEVILGEYNAFVFDEEDENDDEQKKGYSQEEVDLVRQHTGTTVEIQELLKDLRLLAKSDFRRLLKWRLKMKKYFASLKGTDGDDDGDDEGDDKKKEYTKEELENLEDEKLEADVREMFDAKKREKRKQKRKIRQEKIKRERVMQMGGIKKDDVWEIGKQEMEAEGLFSLKDFEDAEELKNFMDGNSMVLLPGKRKKIKIRSFTESFEDSDEELEVEEGRLDELYARYKKNHGLRTKKEERKAIKDGIGLESDDDFSDFMSDKEQEEAGDGDDESDEIEEDEEEEEEGEEQEEEEQEDQDVDMEDLKEMKKKLEKDDNELIVEEKEFVLKEDSKMTKAKRWFSDNIFDNIETNEALDEKQMKQQFGDLVEDEDDDGDFEIVKDPNKAKRKEKNKETINNKNWKEKMPTRGSGPNGAIETKLKLDDGKDLKYRDLPEILKLPYKVRMKMKKMNRDHRRRLKREEEKRKERDCLFEEVPEALDDSSTDSEAIAEVQALGARMLKKKDRMDMINASYNRYAFDDDGCQLPDWFKDDENANYKVNLPVTKEEVREYKERLKAINARPIKKVAEAKARKKLKAQRIWNKIKRQATSIADNNDLSEKTKIKQIEKLYGKLGKKKNKRVYMVTTSMGRKARPIDGKKPPKGAAKVYVDKRMKADKLGVKHATKRGLKKKLTRKASSRRRRNVKNKRAGR